MKITEDRPISSVYLVAANDYVPMLEQPPNADLTHNLAFVLRDYLKAENAKRELATKARDEFLENMGILWGFHLRRIEISQHEVGDEGDELGPQCLVGWWSEGGDECDKTFSGDTIQDAVSKAAAYLREQEAKYPDPPEFEHPLSLYNRPF